MCQGQYTMHASKIIMRESILLHYSTVQQLLGKVMTCVIIFTSGKEAMARIRLVFCM